MILTLILTVSNVKQAQADRRTHIPKTFVQKGKYRCYDIKGFKELLVLDANYPKSIKDSEKKEQIILSKEDIIDSYKKQLKNYRRRNHLLSSDNTLLYGKYVEANKRMHIAENKVDNSWIAWTIAGVSLAVAGSLSVVVVAKK